MTLEQTVSRRIAMLRPLLILGVVFVHVSGVPEDLLKLQGVFEFFAGFLKNTLFRASVPTMSIIAGFLLFSMNRDKEPIELFKKKFATLAIPFVVFNISYVFFVITMKCVFNIVFTIDIAKLNGIQWFNIFFGLTDYPLNYPLYFLRDMIVMAIISPILGLILRHAAWSGLIILSIVIWFDLDGSVIFRSTNLIMFYVGGMIAIKKWNVLAADKLAVPALVGLIALCISFLVFRANNIVLLVLVLPFLVWPAASLLHATRIEKIALEYSHYSFFIFGAHVPLLVLSWWMVNNYVRLVPTSVYWITAPIVTVLVLIAVHDRAMRVAPRVFSVMIGGHRKKLIEVRGGRHSGKQLFDNTPTANRSKFR